MAYAAAYSGLRQRDLVVLGFRGVGKSAVVIRFCEDSFTDAYNPTIENTFHKTITFQNEEIELAIRDTTGQDELTVFHPRNCLGVHGYMLVFSVTSRYSFEIVNYIHNKLLTNLMGSTKDVPRVLIGNKADLEIERQVTFDEGKALADEWGCPYMEVSAKDGSNIQDAFLRLLKEVRKDERPEYIPRETSTCCGCVTVREGEEGPTAGDRLASCLPAWCCACERARKFADTRQERVKAVQEFVCLLSIAAGGLYVAAGVAAMDARNHPPKGGLRESGGDVGGWTPAAVLAVGVLMVVRAGLGLYGARTMQAGVLQRYGLGALLVLVLQGVFFGVAVGHGGLPGPDGTRGAGAWLTTPAVLAAMWAGGALVEFCSIFSAWLLYCSLFEYDEPRDEEAVGGGVYGQSGGYYPDGYVPGGGYANMASMQNYGSMGNVPGAGGAYGGQQGQGGYYRNNVQYQQEQQYGYPPQGDYM